MKIAPRIAAICMGSFLSLFVFASMLGVTQHTEPKNLFAGMNDFMPGQTVFRARMHAECVTVYVAPERYGYMVNCSPLKSDFFRSAYLQVSYQDDRITRLILMARDESLQVGDLLLAFPEAKRADRRMSRVSTINWSSGYASSYIRRDVPFTPYTFITTVGIRPK